MSRPARSTNSVSLFPFLAVLVCAMGALIFLLLVTTHRIRKQAKAQAAQAVVVAQEPEPPPEPKPPVVIAVDPIEPEPQEPAVAPLPQWQPPEKIIIDRDDEVRELISFLAARRDAGRRQIAARQADLESHRQKVVESQTELQQAQARLKALQAAESQDRQALSQREIKQASLQRQLTELEQKLAKTQKHKAQAATKYSIIPYDGQLGTTRRPILIECSHRGLRFLPEDILLESEDLDGFTVRRNPALAGASALVNYWNRARKPRLGEPPEPEPYVLLVVRPSGSLAYYAARKLLGALDHPMGYELVAEDWELDLPQSDPGAVAACRKAVAGLISERKRMMSILRDGPARGPDGRIIHFDNRTGLIDVRETDREADDGDGWGFGEEQAGDEAVTQGGDPRSNFDSPVRLGGDGEVGGGNRLRSSNLTQDGAGPRGDGFESPSRQMPDASGRLPAFPGNGPDGRPLQPRARQQPVAQQETARAQPTGQQRRAEQQPSAEQQRAEQPVARFGSPLGEQFGSAPSDQSRQADGGGLGSASGVRKATVDRSRSSQNRFGDPKLTRDTADAPEQDEPRPDGSSRWTDAKKPKIYEFGNRSARSLDEAVPEDQMPSLGPTPTLKRRPKSRQFRQRRWGLYGPKATIGFERQITVRIESNQLILNGEHRIAIPDNQPRGELATKVLGLIDKEVRSWGWPPQNFYWVPSIRFVVLPGGNSHYERIHGPLRAEGLSTTVELQLKPGASVTQGK